MVRPISVDFQTTAVSSNAIAGRLFAVPSTLVKDHTYYEESGYLSTYKVNIDLFRAYCQEIPLSILKATGTSTINFTNDNCTIKFGSSLRPNLVNVAPVKPGFDTGWCFIFCLNGAAEKTVTVTATIKNIVWEVSDGRIIQTGKFLSSGLPNITGSATGTRMANIYDMDGALSITGTSSAKNFANGEGSSSKLNGFDFNASRSTLIYGSSCTVRPDSMGTQFCIKY